MSPRRILAAALTAILLGWGTAAAAPAPDVTRPTSGSFSQPPGGLATGLVEVRAPAGQPSYLSLGDSLAAGYQPERGEDRSGGYAGVVLAALHQSGPAVRLSNLSCSGETTQTMLSGGICYRDGDSQLTRAVAELDDPASRIRLITVSIGANDVQRCVSATGIDVACVTGGIAGVGTRLPQILSRIRAAAPTARIVLLNYYNPFLATWLTGGQGPVLALASRAVQEELNATIARSARPVRARVADVSAAFGSTEWTPQQTPGLGSLPANVARVCALTWMCVRTDSHPNDAGYRVLATAVLAQLRRG